MEEPRQHASSSKNEEIICWPFILMQNTSAHIYSGARSGFERWVFKISKGVIYFDRPNFVNYNDNFQNKDQIYH